MSLSWARSVTGDLAEQVAGEFSWQRCTAALEELESSLVLRAG